MERDEQQLKGWRLFRFSYGAIDVANLPFADEDDAVEPTCKQESCGCGCSVAVVDFDRLDQQ